MNRRLTVLVPVLLATITATAVADPILKPRKYFGPIPQNSISFRVGFLGGAEAAEMIEFLDADKQAPEEARSDDFGNGLAFDLTYIYKPHPQFGFRANASVTLLTSTGEGFFVGDMITPPDTTRPLIDYTREFNVDLFALELSGVYFFTDAAVQEFQPYIGGGFTIGFPHAKFDEQQTVRDGVNSGVTTEIVSDKWSVEPGVHAMLGAFYYVTNRFAFSAEGRYQFLQSKYPVDVINESGGIESADFIISYQGFYLTIGVTRAF